MKSAGDRDSESPVRPFGRPEVAEESQHCNYGPTIEQKQRLDTEHTKAAKQIAGGKAYRTQAIVRDLLAGGGVA